MAVSLSSPNDQSLISKLQDLQRLLAKKNSFEGAIGNLQTLCEHEFSDSISIDLKREWLKVFQRCFTLLRTRYTVRSFWRGGYNLFLSAKVGYLMNAYCESHREAGLLFPKGVLEVVYGGPPPCRQAQQIH